MPVMSFGLPKSFRDLLHEWRTNNLASFKAEKSKNLNWGDDVAIRFSKRVTLLSTIEARAATTSQTLEESADAMDKEREICDADGRGTGKFLSLNKKLSECRSFLTRRQQQPKRPRLTAPARNTTNIDALNTQKRRKTK